MEEPFSSCVTALDENATLLADEKRASASGSLVNEWTRASFCAVIQKENSSSAKLPATRSADFESTSEGPLFWREDDSHGLTTWKSELSL